METTEEEEEQMKLKVWWTYDGMFTPTRYLYYWIELASVIVALATLGLYHPQWDTYFLVWDVKRRIRRKGK